MGKSEQGDEELVDSIDETDPLPTDQRVSGLKAACVAEGYAILLQVLVFFKTISIQILTIFVLILIDLFAPTVPTVTFSPVALQMGGEGLPVTYAVIATAIAIAAKRLYELNTSGYPETKIKMEGEEDG
ncbi:hypothetical protein JMJ58_14970 [Haloterrigena salifodinae]|uniref:Uncharacterized protein n=1 Tax=Haloterrigena salifodinae TaxID=2675099 RepID=A0A8T8DYI5_9EURY|nr:hypothetical protein [Haloterrigena salifodinae]QRV14236.1 hypothetical protein JMJ58_14970 [Haloterrigena salifodinae]